MHLSSDLNPRLTSHANRVRTVLPALPTTPCMRVRARLFIISAMLTSELSSTHARSALGGSPLIGSVLARDKKVMGARFVLLESPIGECEAPRL